MFQKLVLWAGSEVFWFLYSRKLLPWDSFQLARRSPRTRRRGDTSKLIRVIGRVCSWNVGSRNRSNLAGKRRAGHAARNSEAFALRKQPMPALRIWPMGVSLLTAPS